MDWIMEYDILMVIMSDEAGLLGKAAPLVLLHH